MAPILPTVSSCAPPTSPALLRPANLTRAELDGTFVGFPDGDLKDAVLTENSELGRLFYDILHDESLPMCNARIFSGIGIMLYPDLCAGGVELVNRLRELPCFKKHLPLGEPTPWWTLDGYEDRRSPAKALALGVLENLSDQAGTFEGDFDVAPPDEIMGQRWKEVMEKDKREEEEGGAQDLQGDEDWDFLWSRLTDLYYQWGPYSDCKYKLRPG